MSVKLTPTITEVSGAEEKKCTYVKRQSNFLLFSIEWWEKISEEHVGNDIETHTTSEIRNVYLNGEKNKLSSWN